MAVYARHRVPIGRPVTPPFREHLVTSFCSCYAFIINLQHHRDSVLGLLCVTILRPTPYLYPAHALTK